MKKKNGQLLWIPLWIDKWIFGSTRIELEPDERSVWVDLMALAAKDLGFIRANETTPYYARQLSGLLNITEELLARTIKKCLEVDKLTMNEKGIIYLTNWDGFQLSERYKRRIKKREKENTITDGNPFWDKVSVLCPKKFRKMASKNNMVRLNRLIAAYFIDRCLKEEEEVHHLDGNENNNYPKNLILFGNHSDHQKFHWNHDINIIWDGRKETEETISALYAELTASDATNRHTREYKEENIKKIREEKEVFDFEFVWSLYPPKNRVGKKEAIRHFEASVKTPQDFEDIQTALKNYLLTEPVKKGYVKNGATFFNNWSDYLTITPMDEVDKWRK